MTTAHAASAPRTTATEEDAAWFKGWFSAILDNVESVVRGKTNQVALVLSCFFAEGHLLLEDKPGTGKTTLAKALAASIQGCLLYTSPSPRDATLSRMPSSA